MREQSAEVAKQAEKVAKLPSITLPDGTLLIGCTMSKIENGFVSIRHQDGISKVSLKELDATEKKSLNSTADNWSLEEPSAASKDSTGTFAKIVFKNGLLLKKAQFKEVSDGNLVFMADGKSVSIPVDQFPGELSVLGEEAMKSLAQAKKQSNPESSVASSGGSDLSKRPSQTKRPHIASGDGFVLPGDEAPNEQARVVARQTENERNSYEIDQLPTKQVANENTSDHVEKSGINHPPNEGNAPQPSPIEKRRTIHPVENGISFSHDAVEAGESTTKESLPQNNSDKPSDDSPEIKKPENIFIWFKQLSTELLYGAVTLGVLIGLYLGVRNRKKPSKFSPQVNLNLQHQAATDPILIKFYCPNCDTKIAAEQSNAGTSANCPSCGNELIVPPIEASQPSTARPSDPESPPLPSEPESQTVAGTSDLLGSIRQKVGDLRNQVAASDAPRHALESMKKKAEEIRDQIAGSELPREALEAARFKAAEIRDKMAASEYPRHALAVAQKKASEARDFAVKSGMPARVVAWFRQGEKYRVLPTIFCMIGLGWLSPFVLPERYFITDSVQLIILIIALPLILLSFHTLIKPSKHILTPKLILISFSACLLTALVGINLLLFIQKVGADQLAHFTRIGGGKYGILMSFIYWLIGWLYDGAFNPSVGTAHRILGFVFGVGLCEEFIKIIPVLLFFVFFKQTQLSGNNYSPFLNKEMVIIGIFSGLGFGLGEALFFYSPSSGNSLFENLITRWFAVIPSHAIWSGIVAQVFWMFRDELKNITMKSLVGFALIASMASGLLHGIYDLICGFKLLAIITNILCIGVFYYTLRRFGELGGCGTEKNFAVFQYLETMILKKPYRMIAVGATYLCALFLIGLSGAKDDKDFQTKIVDLQLKSDLGLTLDKDSFAIYQMGYSLGGMLNRIANREELEEMASEAWAKNPTLDHALAGLMIVAMEDGNRGLPNRLDGVKVDTLADSQQEDPMKDLSWYCGQGDLKKVKEKATKYNINTIGEFGYPLHEATKGRHLKVVKYLISLGADVNKMNGWGMFPIHEAATSGDVDTFKYIAKVGGKVDQKSGIPYEDVEHMEGCRILNETPTHDYQPIHTAARNNNFEMVKYIISLGISPLVKDNHGGTPLTYAKNGGEKSDSYQKIIKYLEAFK